MEAVVLFLFYCLLESSMLPDGRSGKREPFWTIVSHGLLILVLARLRTQRKGLWGENHSLHVTSARHNSQLLGRLSHHVDAMTHCLCFWPPGTFFEGQQSCVANLNWGRRFLGVEGSCKAGTSPEEDGWGSWTFRVYPRFGKRPSHVELVFSDTWMWVSSLIPAAPFQEKVNQSLPAQSNFHAWFVLHI